MAGFFSVRGRGQRGGGGGNGGGENPPAEIPPETWLWYKSDELAYKGFDQFQQQDLYSSAAGLGVGPSRTSFNVSDESSPPRSGFAMEGTGGGIVNCRDCGNQAKKDCIHMRCRTCCKSRGFDCPTHVRSTWVSAARRRERQQQQQQQQLAAPPQTVAENPKRQRQREEPSNPPGLEVGNFPAELSTSAVFRCVRVSGIDNTEEQMAYQTAVNIGGHVFRGILYDQGPDISGESSPGGGGGTQRISAPTASVDTAGSGVGMSSSTAAAFIDPSSFYPAPLNSYMAGTHFFSNTRP